MSGRTINVANAAQLRTVLRTVRGGDTVLLAAGDYGNFDIKNLNPVTNVTIKSANASADAVFKTLKLTNISNFIFDDIDIRNPIAPGGALTAGVSVNRSTNVVITGFDVTGSLNGSSFDDAHGIIVTDSSRIAILDSTFRQLRGATVFGRSDDVIFAGNSVTEVREGVNIGQVRGGLFERNYMTNMQPNYAAGDHPDNFQVQAGGTNGISSDLAFRNNIIIEGTSGPVGGIFIRSEKIAQGLRHSNITIENNYYEGTYRHGISVSNTDAVVITGNTVLDSARVGVTSAIITSDLKGALIANNIAPLYLARAEAPSTGVVSRNNIDVWETKTRTGIAQSALFESRGPGDINFDALSGLAGSAARQAGAGFRNVAGIGNLAGDTAAQMATYLPQFDTPFAAHPLV